MLSKTSLLLKLLDAANIPTFCAPSCRGDGSAECDLFWQMSDLGKIVVVVYVLFFIAIEVLLPRWLSRLLGVLHLFVHLGTLTFQCVTHRCLRSQVMLSVFRRHWVSKTGNPRENEVIQGISMSGVATSPHRCCKKTRPEFPKNVFFFRRYARAGHCRCPRKYFKENNGWGSPT
jgi:hypothetical protein